MGAICNTFIVTGIGICFGVGCFEPDPRDVRGALDAAARAIEADDGRALFHLIDQRSRNALHSIAKSRRAAAALIEADYPAPERPQALARLGDAARAQDAAGLFAARCGPACRQDFASRLGAPESRSVDGDELVVTTVTGQQLRLHRGSDGWYGLVWRTAELDRERSRAAQELTQIEANAAVYRRRRSLELTESGSVIGQPPSGASR